MLSRPHSQSVVSRIDQGPQPVLPLLLYRLNRKQMAMCAGSALHQEGYVGWGSEALARPLECPGSLLCGLIAHVGDQGPERAGCPEVTQLEPVQGASEGSAPKR